MKNCGLTLIAVLCSVSRLGTWAKYAQNCPIFLDWNGKIRYKAGKIVTTSVLFFRFGYVS